MIRVGVVGYGTIGKRVAAAVGRQSDMVVAGVAKRSPDYAAALARETATPIYASDEDAVAAFESAGIRTEGTVADLVDRADVVVDATPAGVGAENRELYAETGTPAVLQGGEDADVADVSFNARANYEAAAGADAVRVLSCNCTGLARLLAPLDEAYGVRSARATLVRRGGDPGQTDRGPINDILPDPMGESHHAADVREVLPDVDIRTHGVKVPTTVMHLQTVRVRLDDPPANARAVRRTLAAEPRLMFVTGEFGIEGCGDLMDVGRDSERPRTDLWENCVFEESIELAGNECTLFQAIDQESDVVPENVDAVRAVTGVADAGESRHMTDRALGVGSLPTSPAHTAEVAPVDGDA
jgi:glyceraldehyde-3-phosphate dehydrogenase (NAD(P))